MRAGLYIFVSMRIIQVNQIFTFFHWKQGTNLNLSFVFFSGGFNVDSLRSNDSDDECDDETSPSGQEKDYGAEAVLRWAEVRHTGNLVDS